jgi:protein-disulfide isomerase
MRVKLNRPLLGLLVAAAILVPLVWAQNRTPTPSAGEGDQVVATVGDRTIRMRDLEEHWKGRDAASYTRMRQEMYDANRNVLDDLIGAYLFENEAKKRNLTVDQLLAQELPKRTQPATEEQIRELYEQSRERTQGASLDDLRSAIVTYLERQAPTAARRRYIQELRKGATDVAIHLEPPRLAIAVAPDDPVSGPASARVEIVEFSDFQCPFCKGVMPVLKQLMAKYPTQVKLVWKDFPLPSHPDAKPAAEAAQCARDQGKFWEYHDKLFDNQSAMTPANLKQWAGQMGMDAAKFGACFDSATHRQRVQGDMDEGSRDGVSSTPTIFINGRALVGSLPIEAYEEVIKEELARK